MPIQTGDKRMTRVADEARNSEATGKDPKDRGMAEPADGKTRTDETKVATTPLSETTGNVKHDFGTVDGIKAWRPNR
jgi:hypothetical protein